MPEHTDAFVDTDPDAKVIHRPVDTPVDPEEGVGALDDEDGPLNEVMDQELVSGLEAGHDIAPGEQSGG